MTLPKVRTREEVAGAVQLLDCIELAYGLRPSTIQLELMIETPDLFGESIGALRQLLRAGDGRIQSLHLGAYDFLSALGVAASSQTLAHPFCDLARGLLKIAAEPMNVGLSDGATTILPIPPHKGAKPGSLEHEINTKAVHAAWRDAGGYIHRAMSQGYLQGWDLHPGQIPMRLATTYLFFRASLALAAKRFEAFRQAREQATRVGLQFDDAATALGLVEFFKQGIACGAFDESDLPADATDASRFQA